MKFKQYNDFPKLNAFLQVRFPTIEIFSPEIFDAFVQLCMSEKLARQALKPDKYPLIKVVRLVSNGYVNKTVAGQYSGECDPTLKNVIFLQKEYIEDYEKGTNSGLSVERVILHEMVHWARYVGGKPARTSDDKEAGTQFEIKAYGIAGGDHVGKACQ